MNLAIFASGNGTNLQAIIDAVSRREVMADIKVVVSDNKKAYALKRAKEAGIKTLVLRPQDFKTREDYYKTIIKELSKDHIELVVLAGFMRLVSTAFVYHYKNRIMNIHPALLPAFKGTHGIRDAFLYGVKKTGVTVHFVDEKLDNGPIILQEAVTVEENDTLETLEKKIHVIEHMLYPKAVQLFIEGRLKIKGRKVKIEEKGV